MPQIWNKEAVAEAICAHVHHGHAADSLWEQDPSLYATAKRHFGTWRSALEAVKMTPAKKRWTKDALIKFIQARYRSLHSCKKSQFKRTSAVCCAAKRLFGSWSAAVRAAGFQPRTCHKWTKAEILQTIRKYHDQGVPFHRVGSQEPKLILAAYYHFGAWRIAVQEAGFDADLVHRWSKPKIIEMLRKRHRFPAEKWTPQQDKRLNWAAREYFGSMEQALREAGIEVPRRWSAARVLAAIQERNRQGLPLTNIAKADFPLYHAATHYYGGWRNALIAAGFPVNIPRKWTKETVLEAIHTQLRKGLSPREIWRNDPQLLSAAKRYFGSQYEVLKILGLPSLQNRNWSKELIIAEIQALHRQGLPLKRFCSQQRALYRAACYHFGGWADTVQAAGFKAKAQQRWSKEKVLEELGAHYRKAEFNISRLDPKLARAAAHLFGSLDNAWESFGVSPSPSHRWSKERIIEAIQDGYVQGLPIHIRGFRDVNLADAAHRYFGNWTAAVVAAGLSAELAQKPFRSWSREKVIEALQAWERQGKSLTSVWRKDPGVYSQARYYFGSWLSAVEAAKCQVFESTED